MISYFRSRIAAGALFSILACTLVEAGDSVPARQNTFGKAAPLTAASLRAVAGKADLSQVSRTQTTSVVANNSVNGQSTTGSLTLDGHAFQDLRGLAVVSANTGNNVSMNAAMNVNVAIRP